MGKAVSLPVITYAITTIISKYLCTTIIMEQEAPCAPAVDGAPPQLSATVDALAQLLQSCRAAMLTDDSEAAKVCVGAAAAAPLTPCMHG